MEQIQKQRAAHKREEQVVDELPEAVDETVLSLSTERVLGNIALALYLN